MFLEIAFSKTLQKSLKNASKDFARTFVDLKKVTFVNLKVPLVIGKDIFGPLKKVSLEKILPKSTSR